MVWVRARRSKAFHDYSYKNLAEALIKAGKSFDMLIMPNEDHGMGGTDYFTKVRWNYFVEHLLGAEPLRHYRIGGNGSGSASPADSGKMTRKQGSRMQSRLPVYR